MAAAERKPVDDCADYLLHYSPFLQYDKALAAAYNLLRGVTVNAGVPSSPKAAVPN